MEEVSGHGYKGHLIIAASTPADRGMFYGTFQIIWMDPDAPEKNRPVVHQQGKSGDFVFPTDHDAMRESISRAEAWVDTHAA